MYKSRPSLLKKLGKGPQKLKILEKTVFPKFQHSYFLTSTIKAKKKEKKENQFDTKPKKKT